MPDEVSALLQEQLDAEEAFQELTATLWARPEVADLEEYVDLLPRVLLLQALGVCFVGRSSSETLPHPWMAGTWHGSTSRSGPSRHCGLR